MGILRISIIIQTIRYEEDHTKSNYTCCGSLQLATLTVWNQRENMEYVYLSTSYKFQDECYLIFK